MMSTDLVLSSTGALVIPDHLKELMEHGNIVERSSVNSLSYEGKVWAITINGEKTKLERTNEDGDRVPVSIMRVIVLDYAKERGRAYYEGTYDPGNPGSPTCWSTNGQTPDSNVEAPKALRCDTCEFSKKGSKITDNGKAVVACSQHRILAVIPSNKPDFPPLRMKIAITSDWDKNPDLAKTGWHAFKNYYDWLKGRGIGHTAGLVTKMKFDPDVAYPKVIFSPDRMLSAEEMRAFKPIIFGDEVQSIITSGGYTPAAKTGDGADAPVSAAKPAPIQAAPKTAPKPAPAPAPVAQDEDEEYELPTVKAAAPEPEDEAVDEPEPAPAPKATKGKAKPAAAPKPAPQPEVTSNVPSDVADLLTEWGD